MRRSLSVRRCLVEPLESRELLTVGSNGHYYLFVNGPRTFDEADASAKSTTVPAGFGPGHLVSIGDAAENRYVADLVGDNSNIWIGFTDQDLEGRWRWTDGTPGVWEDSDNFPNPVRTTFTRWAFNEPDNDRGELPNSQDYAVLDTQSGLWRDEHQSRTFPFVVEFEPLPDVAPNGHYYERVPGEAMSWQEAQAAAAQRTRPPGFRAGHLVSISDAAENDYVNAKFGGEAFWLGFTDQTNEGEWRWVDQTPGTWQDPNVYPEPIQTAFSNWDVDEPSRAADDGDFAYFRPNSAGRWAVGSEPLTNLVIEYEPISPGPTNLALSSNLVPEMSPAGTVVGELSVVDADQASGHVYQIITGTDLFEIRGRQLRVAPGAVLDFETAVPYELLIRATDRTQKTVDQYFTIKVSNLNEPPQVTAPAEVSLERGSLAAIGPIKLADPDLDQADRDITPLRLSLSAERGTVSLSALNGVSVVDGANGSGTLTLEGPLNRLEAALRTLTYQADPAFVGRSQLQVSLDDLGRFGQGGPLSHLQTIRLLIGARPITRSDAYEVGFGRTLRAQSYAGTLLADQPSAYWKLDDLGPTVLDSVGNYLGVASAGTQFSVPGALASTANHAAAFRDLEARIVVEGAAPLAQLQREFSIEAWVNPSLVLPTQQIVSTRSGPSEGWSVGLVGQQLAFTAFGVQQYVAEGAAIPLGEWSHVAVVVDAEFNASFYLNGQLLGQVTGAKAPHPGTGRLAIGDNPDQSAQPWQGGLDEVAIFGRSLSGDEIARHFRAAQGDRSLLRNDYDDEAQPLTVVLVAPPAHGTLQLAADGSFSYKPAPGFYGRDTFRYRAVDAYFESAPAEVSIDVIPVPGDTDHDGDVDLADFARLKASFGGLGTREQGDFNGDGKIDLADFGILKSAFGTAEPEDND